MVYILLGEGFEEAEALVTADVLRRADAAVALTGIGGDFVTGSHGVTVKADLSVDSVTLEAGDMVVLPGGMGGVASMEGSDAAMGLIRQAAGNPEIWLAAICAAPTLLARAGLLPKGVPCVCYPGMEGELEKAGALPRMDEPVVIQGRLITSQAPGTAFDFALALVEQLAGIPTACRLHTDLHYGA
mgnify:FL=1